MDFETESLLDTRPECAFQAAGADMGMRERPRQPSAESGCTGAAATEQARDALGDSLDAAVSNISLLYGETRKTIRHVRRRIKYLTYHELPHHLKHNYYIHSGYRAYYTVGECFRSIFEVHNETGNIWTHMVGAVFFLGCMYMSLCSLPPNADVLDYCMVSIFLLSAIKCLVFSTLYHTLCAHAQMEVFESCTILDYSGISFLIFGSFLIVLNYGLYCYTFLRWFYIGLVGSVCFLGVVLPWFAFFRANEFIVGRTLFYVGIGFLSGAVMVHTMYLNGWTLINHLVPLEYLALEIALYLLGAYIYVIKVPEAWFPGRLDTWCHSHQFWHVMVVAAAYCHHQAAMGFMHARLATKCM